MTSVEDQIKALERQFEQLWSRGDAAGLAAMYSACAELLPNEGDAIRDRAEMEALFREYYAVAPTIQLTVKEVIGRGDTAYEVGDFVLLDKDGGQADRGKYIVVWLLTETGWKLHRDIFNTSIPPKK